MGKTARAVEKETLESESSLEPEVAVYDADNSGSSTDVTPVKAEKVLKRKEKPARKRKSTQESSKVVEWLEFYNQERKVEEEKRRKTQEQHHQENLSVLSNLVDVLKAWKKWIQLLPDFPGTDWTKRELNFVNFRGPFIYLNELYLQEFCIYLLGFKPEKWIIFEGFELLQFLVENEYLKDFCINSLFLKHGKWIIWRTFAFIYCA